MRVVFFGNSESAFSNRHWIALTAAPCEIVAVVDSPSTKRTSTNAAIAVCSFIEMARAMEIPCFAPLNPNASKCVAAFSVLEPDLLVAVGYTQRLGARLLALPRILPVNFHASLLPAYRGKHPLYWALQNGEQWAGLTVHVMDEGLDTGDILYQVRVPVRAGDTVAALYERVMFESAPLVDRLVRDAITGKLSRTPQPTEGASYYGAIENHQ